MRVEAVYLYLRFRSTQLQMGGRSLVFEAGLTLGYGLSGKRVEILNVHGMSLCADRQPHVNELKISDGFE